MVARWDEELLSRTLRIHKANVGLHDQQVADMFPSRLMRWTASRVDKLVNGSALD